MVVLTERLNFFDSILGLFDLILDFSYSKLAFHDSNLDTIPLGLHLKVAFSNFKTRYSTFVTRYSTVVTRCSHFLT